MESFIHYNNAFEMLIITHDGSNSVTVHNVWRSRKPGALTHLLKLDTQEITNDFLGQKLLLFATKLWVADFNTDVTLLNFYYNWNLMQVTLA